MRPQNKKAPKATPHSLEGVARRELGIELDKEHQSSDWSGELSPGMLKYAAKDALVLPPLAESLMAKVMEAGLERVSELEHRALPAVTWMRNAGLPLDAGGDGVPPADRGGEEPSERAPQRDRSRPARRGRVELELFPADQGSLRASGDRASERQVRNPLSLRPSLDRAPPSLSQGLEDVEPLRAQPPGVCTRRRPGLRQLAPDRRRDGPDELLEA